MSHAVANEHRVESILFSRRTSIPLAAVMFAGAGIAGYLLGLPVWIALIGWAVYFTRGSTLHDGAYNLACAITGLGFGIVSLSAAGKLQLHAAWAALPVALLIAAVSVHLMQFITGVSNVPGYYLGILVALVADTDGSLDSYLTLTAAVSVGVFAAALPDLVRRVLGSTAETGPESAMEAER
ncbi:DUF1097 domain-containing protein [Microbulbifer sp. SAOS-129_SWC]|uniref:DUF1097 domain-containing protein n=1 Tax=Microbulbifer sp. SAOS-129_SWC TaxID=3145235 RepID=UPI003216B7A7